MDSVYGSYLFLIAQVSASSLFLQTFTENHLISSIYDSVKRKSGK